MSIIRVEKTANYSIISNLCLRNEKISLKAKGLFSYIMTLPNNWKLNQSDLVNRFPDGRTAISSAMGELEAAGYIHKEKIRDCSGRMAGWVYTVYEHPVSPTSGFPTSVNPTSDNRPLVSTNREVNTNSSNTPVIKDNKQPVVGDKVPSLAEPCFKSEAFTSAWGDWIQHRKEIKRRLTPKASESQMANFAKWGEARAIAAIRHSICHGWQGIFEPDSKNKYAEHHQKSGGLDLNKL